MPEKSPLAALAAGAYSVVSSARAGLADARDSAALTLSSSGRRLTPQGGAHIEVVARDEHLGDFNPGLRLRAKFRRQLPLLLAHTPRYRWHRPLLHTGRPPHHIDFSLNRRVSPSNREILFRKISFRQGGFGPWPAVLW